MNVLPTPWDDRVLVVGGEAPAEWFTERELGEVASFRLAKRRDEWMRGRFAAKQLALKLGICREPQECVVARPHLLVRGEESGWNVSISHTEGWAAAAISLHPVGIDVQVVRTLPAETAHLFLTDEEIAAMERCGIADALLHFWCAKEAAFKRHSPRYTTMRQTPLQFLAESAVSLRFDDAETLAAEGVIVAISA